MIDYLVDSGVDNLIERTRFDNETKTSDRKDMRYPMGWDILGTSYGTVYSWDIPLECPIGMLFLEYSYYSGVTFGSMMTRMMTRIMTRMWLL